MLMRRSGQCSQLRREKRRNKMGWNRMGMCVGVILFLVYILAGFLVLAGILWVCLWE